MTDTKITLKAEPRTIFGKRVRKMRKDGLLPANVFGQDVESKSLTLKSQEFFNVYKQAGETGVIYIEVGKESIPTLLSDLQYDPRTNMVLHVDFRKVNLKQKVEAHVPLRFEGESEAVKMKNGVLITNLDEVTVEALPTDIPHDLEVDLSKLANIGDHITIADLPSSTKYTYVQEPDTVIVSVTEHVEESIEPETVSEAPEITTEAPAEGEEAPAEGAATAEEKTEEK